MKKSQVCRGEKQEASKTFSCITSDSIRCQGRDEKEQWEGSTRYPDHSVSLSEEGLFEYWWTPGFGRSMFQTKGTASAGGGRECAMLRHLRVVGGQRGQGPSALGRWGSFHGPLSTKARGVDIFLRASQWANISASPHSDALSHSLFPKRGHLGDG